MRHRGSENPERTVGGCCDNERVSDASAGTRVFTGDDVLDWLRGTHGRAVAANLLRHRGFGSGPRVADLIDDVLGEATLGVLGRMARPEPLEVGSPGAYGTTVIRSVVRLLVRGRDVALEDVAEPAELDPDPVDPFAGDEVRAVLEQMPAPPWLTSAALTYLVHLMFPGVVPDGVPRPKAGSNADQARCWPALWFAGERDLFPNAGEDPARRTRARRIDQVLTRVRLAFARLRLDAGVGDD